MKNLNYDEDKDESARTTDSNTYKHRPFFLFWLNKYAYVRLKSGRYYSGRIEEVHDAGNGLVFFTMLDKFGKYITFTSSEIEVIEEERKEDMRT